MACVYVGDILLVVTEILTADSEDVAKLVSRELVGGECSTDNPLAS